MISLLLYDDYTISTTTAIESIDNDTIVQRTTIKFE